MQTIFIIIDENQQHADTVEKLISKDTGFHCFGIFHSLDTAKKIIDQNSIDFIFLDPNVESGSVNKFLLELPSNIKVIIHSGRQKDAVNGYEWGVFDYIPKPLQLERWKITKKRLKNHLYRIDKQHSRLPLNYIEVRCNLMNEKIEYENIRYIEAMGDYIRIVTPHKKFVVLMSMKKINEVLPQKMFFRIHKSYIINLNKITQYTGQEVMLGKLKFPLSRFKRPAFKELLTNS